MEEDAPGFMEEDASEKVPSRPDIDMDIATKLDAAVGRAQTWTLLINHSGC